MCVLMMRCYVEEGWGVVEFKVVLVLVVEENGS